MTPRRPISFLAVVAVFAALALAGVGDAGRSSGASLPTGESARISSSGGVQSSAIRLTTEDRRDHAAQRSLKQRLMLLAIATALLVASMTGRRLRTVRQWAARVEVSWWSARSGRAPPSLQPSIT